MTKQEFLDSLNLMVKAGLVTFIKNKPVFTDAARVHLSSSPSSTQLTTMTSQSLVVAENLEDKYKNFILQCKVPMKGYDSQGNAYSMNNFSKDGLKSFNEILAAGYDSVILQLAVAIYYKSNITYKKAIGNYLISREWVSLYDRVLTEHHQGTLNKFVKNETAEPSSKFFRGGNESTNS